MNFGFKKLWSKLKESKLFSKFYLKLYEISKIKSKIGLEITKINSMLYLLATKLLDVKDKFHIKKISPDITVNNIYALNKGIINGLKKGKICGKPIKGAILDIDGTLRDGPTELPESSMAWLLGLKDQGLRVTTLSNGRSPVMEEQLSEEDITYTGLAFKPFQRGFTVSCKKMKLPKKKVMVVGNTLGEDIKGGNKAGMLTVLVKECGTPTEPTEPTEPTKPTKQGKQKTSELEH